LKLNAGTLYNAVRAITAGAVKMRGDARSACRHRIWLPCCPLALLACAGTPVVAENRQRVEAEVLEATLRYEIVQFLDREDQQALVCLGVDRDLGELQDPDREFLRRFSDRPEVRRMSECDARPKGVVESRTGKAAVILGAGPLEWIGDDEVHVRGYFFRSEFGIARPLYRVVRENSRFAVLGPFLPFVE
jgi:hypothetical protein